MKKYTNNSTWCDLYTTLNAQAKRKEKIIWYNIPNEVSQEEINEVIKELKSLYNFINYDIIQTQNRIKGVRKNA